MGQRGPQKTPTRILALRGSWLAKTRSQEPHPKPERPVCPNWLAPEAKTLWRQVVTQLHALGLVSKLDGPALARYCALSLQWRKALRFIEEHGETYPMREPDGTVIGVRTFPQVWLMKGLAQDLLRYEREFGMTSSARAAFGAPTPKASNDADQDAKAQLFRQA